GGTDNTVDIVDTATVSVYFVPTCTEPEFIQPSDQFVLNNSFNDTLPVVVSGYNYNYNGFDNVKFQFKESSSPNWVQMETFHKDTTGLGTNAVPIPTTQSYVTYDFDVSDLPDGEYDIRTQSACNYPNTPEVNVNSSILSGILDRVNPSTFGTPSPGDGILSPNDNIEIQFNEPINGAILNAVDNFDIRGVVNGTTLLRSASLFFDGADDYVELAPGLNLTTHSMTIEFWAKRSSLGEQVVFSQGTDPQQTLIAGFDANDRFNFQVGSSTVVADVPMTDLTQWHHYAVSFDYENDEVGLFQDDVLVNVSNLAFSSNYLGSGRTLFGEASSGNKRSFNGYLSEMRIWDEARTLAEVLTFQNISLTGREPHLVSNWSMDEVEGNIVKDHVRQRNGTINNATWNVSPSGNSAGFNGSNFVSIPTADIPITEEMDFTLDFWFKGTGTDMTMFSNGRADTGDETEWAVRFDAEGDLVITHEGADHEIYEEELLEDNTWYHLSVVLRRVSTLSVYMDGNLHRTLSSSLFKGMASPFMFLGARSGNILPSPQTDEYYTGIIGDFSLWNTARAQLQLERDSRNRLQGNEYGLLSYLPFESYQLMNNVPVLTPTFDDQARPGTVVTTTGSPTLPTETPLIKLQRPVESIPFTFSVNNDKINITPTLDPAILENTTIDITVRKVEDMNGNVQQSPATWIAYFDKNQVVWQDMNLNFEKLLNEELSFTSNIVKGFKYAKNLF
ncbi:MAG: LamG-like jellyroll fold domain-containing protein, partial [Saprospiraceae bacterium]